MEYFIITSNCKKEYLFSVMFCFLRGALIYLIEKGLLPLFYISKIKPFSLNRLNLINLC